MKVIYILLFIFSFNLLNAQSTDSLTQAPPVSLLLKDSLVKKEKKRFFKDLFNFKKDYPSPRKAVLLSAILPGTGQIYNKKYWKLPLVYGALGGLVYAINFNTSEYNRFQTALEKRLDDDEFGTIDEFSDVIDGELIHFVDTPSIRGIRDEYRKNKELSYIGLVAVYILTGVDAYVDAHLIKFDVSDDLSLHVNPSFKVLPDRTTSLGVGVGLNIKGKEQVELPVEFLAR